MIALALQGVCPPRPEQSPAQLFLRLTGLYLGEAELGGGRSMLSVLSLSGAKEEDGEGRGVPVPVGGSVSTNQAGAVPVSSP